MSTMRDVEVIEGEILVVEQPENVSIAKTVRIERPIDTPSVKDDRA